MLRRIAGYAQSRRRRKKMNNGEREKFPGMKKTQVGKVRPKEVRRQDPFERLFRTSKISSTHF